MANKYDFKYDGEDHSQNIGPTAQYFTVHLQHFYLIKNSTSEYGASLKAFEMLMNEYDHTLVHVFAKADSDMKIKDKIYSNNAVFLSNEYITSTTNVRTIEELHPYPWIESWKTKNPIEVKNLNDVKVVKKHCVNKKQVFDEIDETDLKRTKLI